MWLLFCAVAKNRSERVSQNVLQVSLRFFLIRRSLVGLSYGMCDESILYTFINDKNWYAVCIILAGASLLLLLLLLMRVSHERAEREVRIHFAPIHLHQHSKPILSH